MTAVLSVINTERPGSEAKTANFLLLKHLLKLGLQKGQNMLVVHRRSDRNGKKGPQHHQPQQFTDPIEMSY